MDGSQDNELWHWIANGTVAVLIGIVGFFAKRTADQLDGKVDRTEFKQFLDETTRSRTELRDSIVKLFERAEQHDLKDQQRFETVTKDFNGGLARLTDTIYTMKLELLREINGKADRGKR